MVIAEHICHNTRSCQQGKPFEKLPRKSMGYINIVLSSVICKHPVCIQCELWHWWTGEQKIIHSSGNNLKHISESGLCVRNKGTTIRHCLILIHVSASVLAPVVTYHTWCLITQGQGVPTVFAYCVAPTLVHFSLHAVYVPGGCSLTIIS